MTAAALVRVTFGGILLLAAVPLEAEWNWQSPLPQGNSLRDVQFIDASNGWAVGEYGTIVHTTNGGASWYEQEFARTDNILAISMISLEEGWAAGDNGVILHTTDSGDDWIEQESGIQGGLNAILFRDSFNGWAAGDNEVILHTSDGGTTWSVQHQVANPNTVLNALAFVNSTQGWAVGASRKVYHTTDGGLTWLARVVGSGISASYLTVAFVDSLLGFIAGSGGELYRTTDGGATWPAVSSGDAENLNQILMQNSFVGWMVGDGSKVLRTINGGLSWSTVVIGDGEDYSGIARVGGTLWAVGEVGKIIQSTNGGTAWSSVDIGSRLSANWIDVPTPAVGVAVGQTGLILRTTDAGSTWTQQVSPAPSVSCYGVKFIDADHGWAVGDNGTIIRTFDGTNWTTEPSGVTHSLFGITFGTPSAGWIVGGEANGLTGVILNSTNAGASWSVQFNGVPHILYGVSFPNAQNGWAVGEQGYILRTTNGGTSWTPQTSGTIHALFWCSFPDPNNGWAVGDSGVILHTSNAGASWQTQPSGVDVPLFSIAHVTSSEIFIAGDQGTILHTSDAGLHWGLQYSRTLNSLFGLSTPGAGRTWACGDFGTIIDDTLNLHSGSITGIVYFDRNNNGGYDAGDSTLGGWKVRIQGPVSDSVVSSPDGTFTFENLLLGSYTLSETVRQSWTQTAPPTLFYSATLSGASSSFDGSFGNYAASAVPCGVVKGWNTLSLPLRPDAPRAADVYPTASSPPYAFAGAYIVLDTLSPGMAYWIKFRAPQTLWVTGTPSHDDTLALQAGWNMFGTISDSLVTTAISTDPPGLIVSHFFGYYHAYGTVSVLAPGQGYWVKLSQAGNLILHSGAATAGSGVSPHPKGFESLNTLTFSDSNGNDQPLYFRVGVNPDVSDDHALPPVPPEGCFDARFQGDHDAYFFASSALPFRPGRILLHSTGSPLSVTWSLRDSDRLKYRLETESGGIIATVSGDTGLVTIQNANMTSVLLRPVPLQEGSGLPASFSLFQNSPNPFNPSTRIEFSIPALTGDPASGGTGLVTLKVYDLLGREVATLVQERMEPGFHEVVWDAVSLPTGVYTYRLVAGPNTAVKKMVLLR